MPRKLFLRGRLLRLDININKTSPSKIMSETQSIIDLYQQLDDLWIRYLDLLDQYTNAQASIKKCLGQGFFSLAQANFTSQGRRYGQDYYDQRAIASTRVETSNESTEMERPRIKIISLSTEVKPAKQTATHLPTPEPESEDEQCPEPENPRTQLPTPEPEDKNDADEKKEEEPQRLPVDPLRQFGILIPPALKSAQKSFAKAVRDEDALIKAVNATRELREVEVEIRKARKVLKKAEKSAEVVGEKV